jgi:uncharacterized repeat protein (TIGR01451 family)
MKVPRFRNWLPPVAALAAAMCLAAVGVAAPTDTSDLRITKADSPDPIAAGSTLTYTIQVQNLGPDPATGVVVSDPLPKGVDFVSATATQGTCAENGKAVRCDLGAIAAPAGGGGTPTITLAVTPRRAGTFSNTASVDGVEKDPVAGNDRASVATTVSASATCRGVAVTGVGTRGDDTLSGTPGADVIAGLGGNDSISSLSGRDLICGGGGNDRVGAGSASDRVFAGAGRDRVSGRGGPDLLRGGAGGDLLLGNAGADRLRGGAGSDRCRGGAGVDSVRGCER